LKPKGLPFLREISAFRKGAHAARGSITDTIEALASPASEDYSFGEELKSGHLTKTSQSKGKKSTPGISRERKFRLTPQSLDYLHTFSHVCTWAALWAAL